VPVLCPRGTSSPGSRITCDVNRGNLISAKLASGQQATTSYCSAGYYYMFNSTDPISRCNPCPRGHACAGQNAWPVPCSSGYYAHQEGMTSCVQCPAGYMCPFPENDKVACPTTASSNGVEGYNSVAGSTSCYPVYGSCTAGYYKYPEPMAT
jgi:hypothetical protein